MPGCAAARRWPPGPFSSAGVGHGGGLGHRGSACAIPASKPAAVMLIAPTKVVLAAVRFSFMCTPSIGMSATCADAPVKTDPASDQDYPELTVG